MAGNNSGIFYWKIILLILSHRYIIQIKETRAGKELKLMMGCRKQKPSLIAVTRYQAQYNLVIIVVYNFG